MQRRIRRISWQTRSGENESIDGLIVEMSEADYAAMFEGGFSSAAQACLYFPSDDAASAAVSKLPEGYMGLLSTSGIYVQSAGDVFTSNVLWYVALIAASLLVGVLIGIIFMRSVKIYQADFAVYRTLGIPNKVSSRSLYIQMVLIFLPTLVLLPLVSLVAAVIPGSSLAFISAGNYFFIEVMLLLIVELVAFGFNKSLNGQSIRKSLRRGSIMIKIENIGKVFNAHSRNRNEVLKGVSFELPEKGFIAIYGKSGSGKTTLLNIIGGLDRQDSGKIYIDGENVAGKVDKIRNAKIGFIFQNYYLERGYTIAEIMRNAMHIAGFKDEAEIERRSEEVLTLVDMERFKNKQGDALSGGQKQRVAIARALIKGADIILADEPTGNLDAENTMKVMDILKEISKTKLVVVVTHEITLIKKYADSYIKLVDGKLDENTDLGEVFEYDTEHNNIYVDGTPAGEVKEGALGIEFYGGKPEEKDTIQVFNDSGSIYIKTGKNVTVLDDKSEKKIIFRGTERQSEEEQPARRVPDFTKSTANRNGRLFTAEEYFQTVPLGRDASAPIPRQTSSNKCLSSSSPRCCAFFPSWRSRRRTRGLKTSSLTETACTST